MPQAIVCEKCREALVFMGTSVELVGESRVGYRHSCGAVNELQYLHEDEDGRAVFRVVGLVPTAHRSRGGSDGTSTGRCQNPGVAH